MFTSNNKNEDTNFWLSYADLMAGLLFVFILLIGAIVVKSTLLKSNLDSTENSLENSLSLLLLRDTEVQKLKKFLALRTAELKDKELLTLLRTIEAKETKYDALIAKLESLRNSNRVLEKMSR